MAVAVDVVSDVFMVFESRKRSSEYEGCLGRYINHAGGPGDQTPASVRLYACRSKMESSRRLAGSKHVEVIAVRSKARSRMSAGVSSS